MRCGTGLPTGQEHFSCRCNKIIRSAPAQDRCTECRKPLILRYVAGRLIDPNIHVRILGEIIADQIKRLRAVIDDHRPYLSLPDVSRALQSIDEERHLLKLHDLGDTPLVMPRDYGAAPSQISNLKSEISNSLPGGHLMNCPNCHVTVGNDLHRIGPWVSDLDAETGQVCGFHRVIVVLCDHCGVFTATQSGGGSITAISHITNPRDRRRYIRKIPGARFAEVAA